MIFICSVLYTSLNSCSQASLFSFSTDDFLFGQTARIHRESQRDENLRAGILPRRTSANENRPARDVYRSVYFCS